MSKLVWLFIGLAIGVVLGLFLRAKGTITYPEMHGLHEWVHILGDGDPPVLVSDLHAFSYDGWKPSSSADTISPNGATTGGVLANTCDNMTGNGLVKFYDGKTDWDASPLAGKALDMTIIHGGQPIKVATQADYTNLTFTDPNHHWGKPSGGTVDNSSNDDIDAVEYIDPGTGMLVRRPTNGNRYAYVAFCYH